MFHHIYPRSPSRKATVLAVKCVLLLGWMVGDHQLQAAPAADGLFATFTVKRGLTSVGEFVCKLEFTKVPRTVANFVGLAEGSRAFIDFQRGLAVRRPFYDGLTFHRVDRIPSPFVIQGGAPGGDETGGPGYTFRDEFDATLRHAKAGMLSMANSGPNSNGSQFFVTLAATPWLDGVHSVFGEVIEGLSVVEAVQQGDTIERVNITRNGAAALAFDADAQGLPAVGEGQPSLVRSLAGFELHYAQPPNAEFFVFHSDTLASWSQLLGKELEGVNPLVAARDVSAVTAGRAMKFFSVARAQYPDAIYTPPAVVGKRLTLANASSAGTFTLQFSLTGTTTGSLLLTPTGQPALEAELTNHVWLQEAYRGRLTADTSGLSAGGAPITLVNVSFVFTSPTGGTAGGSFWTALGPVPLAGTFSLSDLP